METIEEKRPDLIEWISTNEGDNESQGPDHVGDERR